MPVIVIGADTPLGGAITSRLVAMGGEVRAFVSDPAVAETLRAGGIKVALGDVSDTSHLGGASLGCFTAVVLPEAAYDDRGRAFAHSPADVVASWAEALRDAAVRRVIWIDDTRLPKGPEPFGGVVEEVATIPAAGVTAPQIADEVARIDALRTLGEV